MLWSLILTQYPSPKEAKSPHVATVGGTIRIMNTTSAPIPIKRNEHVSFARPTEDQLLVPGPSPQSPLPEGKPRPQYLCPRVNIDPDNILPVSNRTEFHKTLEKFYSLFTPKITGSAAGPIEGVVNMDPVQPLQRKGRIP